MPVILIPSVWSMWCECIRSEAYACQPHGSSRRTCGLEGPCRWISTPRVGMWHKPCRNRKPPSLLYGMDEVICAPMSTWLPENAPWKRLALDFLMLRPTAAYLLALPLKADSVSRTTYVATPLHTMTRMIGCKPCWKGQAVRRLSVPSSSGG